MLRATKPFVTLLFMLLATFRANCISFGDERCAEALAVAAELVDVDESRASDDIHEHLAIAWAQCGEFEEALGVLAKLNWSGARWRAWQGVIEAACVQNSAAFGEQLAESAADDSDRLAALVVLAREYAKQGRHERLDHIITQLLEIARREERESRNKPSDGAAFYEVAATLIDVSEYDRAEMVSSEAPLHVYIDSMCRIAEEVPDGDTSRRVLQRAFQHVTGSVEESNGSEFSDRSLSMGGLSGAAARCGLPDLSADFLAELKPGLNRDIVMSENALVFGRANEAQRAFRLTATIGDAERRCRTYLVLATVLHSKGAADVRNDCLSEASRIVETISEDSRAPLLGVLAGARAFCGGFDEALRILTLLDRDARGYGAYHVGTAALRIGEFDTFDAVLSLCSLRTRDHLNYEAGITKFDNDEQEAALERIDSAQIRESGFANIAITAAESGDPVGAIQIWRAIGSTATNDAVSVAIALAHAANGELENVCKYAMDVGEVDVRLDTIRRIGRLQTIQDDTSLTSVAITCTPGDPQARAWMLLGLVEHLCESTGAQQCRN